MLNERGDMVESSEKRFVVDRPDADADADAEARRGSRNRDDSEGIAARRKSGSSALDRIAGVAGVAGASRARAVEGDCDTEGERDDRGVGGAYDTPRQGMSSVFATDGHSSVVAAAML